MKIDRYKRNPFSFINCEWTMDHGQWPVSTNPFIGLHIYTAASRNTLFSVRTTITHKHKPWKLQLHTDTNPKFQFWLSWIPSADKLISKTKTHNTNSKRIWITGLETQTHIQSLPTNNKLLCWLFIFQQPKFMLSYEETNSSLIYMRHMNTTNMILYSETKLNLSFMNFLSVGII